MRPVDSRSGIPAFQWAWDLATGKWTRPVRVTLAPHIGGNGAWNLPPATDLIARWIQLKHQWQFVASRLSQVAIQITRDRIGPVRRSIESPDKKYWACVLGGMPGSRMHCIPTPSEIALLNSETGEARSLGKSSPLTPVFWSESGDRLLLHSQDGLALYRIDSPRTELVGDDTQVHSACFHPTTGAIWGIRGSTELVECVEGKWQTRFTVKP